ncbi:hypothetical protein XENTR_v10014257 [Xenopus tropicalis]|nr:hypothetical protein XENTR_v10014257 [Xenopus tropicalis]
MPWEEGAAVRAKAQGGHGVTSRGVAGAARRWRSGTERLWGVLCKATTVAYVVHQRFLVYEVMYLICLSCGE